ncbi:MAG: hypothetical protein JW874_09140 [Spirochaetales bacterium]|nr:hypothetical protein [Spirochaetales bacterium]
MNGKFIILFILINPLLFAQVSDYSEMPITYPEVWSINGIDYQIPQTVITGNALYTIHAIVDFQPSMDSECEEIARAIARYAILNGYLNNALKYNLYNPEFHIFPEVIGVALIHIDNTETGEISGSRFGIILEDLFQDPYEVIEFILPESFNIQSELELKSTLEEIIKSRRFGRVLELYSENALDDFDNDDARMRIQVMWSLAEDIKFQGDSFFIYTGQKSGINGYDFYFPIEIIPVADNSIKIKAYPTFRTS